MQVALATAYTNGLKKCTTWEKKSLSIFTERKNKSEMHSTADILMARSNNLFLSLYKLTSK